MIGSFPYPSRLRLGRNARQGIAKGRQIVAALTGNPNFTTPQPALTVVTAAIDELDAAYADLQAARQTATAKTVITHQKDDALEGLLRQLAAYVESVSRDDEPKIRSAGMSVRSAASSTPSAASPTGPSLTEGDHEGEIDLHWNTVKGAKSYEIQRSPDPPAAASWVHEAVSSKSSATVSGRKRHSLLVPRRCSDERRPKRLERPGKQNRALSEG